MDVDRAGVCLLFYVSEGTGQGVGVLLFIIMAETLELISAHRPLIVDSGHSYPTVLI